MIRRGSTRHSATTMLSNELSAAACVLADATTDTGAQRFGRSFGPYSRYCKHRTLGTPYKSLSIGFAPAYHAQQYSPLSSGRGTLRWNVAFIHSSTSPHIHSSTNSKIKICLFHLERENAVNAQKRPRLWVKSSFGERQKHQSIDTVHGGKEPWPRWRSGTGEWDRCQAVAASLATLSIHLHSSL